jgi:hypothetical protein
MILVGLEWELIGTDNLGADYHAADYHGAYHHGADYHGADTSVPQIAHMEGVKY